MVCNNCRNEIQYNYEICPKCGSLISITDREEEVKNRKCSIDLSYYERSRNFVGKSIIIVASLSIIGFIILFWLSVLAENSLAIVAAINIVINVFLIIIAIMTLKANDSDGEEVFLKKLASKKGYYIFAIVAGATLGGYLLFIGAIRGVVMASNAKEALNNIKSEKEKNKKGVMNPIYPLPEMFPNEKIIPLTGYLTDSPFQIIGIGVSKLGEYPYYMRLIGHCYKQIELEEVLIKISFEEKCSENAVRFKKFRKEDDNIVSTIKSEPVKCVLTDEEIQNGKPISAIVEEYIEKSNLKTSLPKMETPQNAIALSDDVKIKLGNDAVCKYKATTNGWICCCGHTNSNNVAYCTRCRRENILNTSIDSTRNNGWHNLEMMAYSASTVEEWIEMVKKDQSAQSCEGINEFLEECKTIQRNERVYGCSYINILVEKLKEKVN